jgi:hypothetical protein
LEGVEGVMFEAYKMSINLYAEIIVLSFLAVGTEMSAAIGKDSAPCSTTAIA